MKSIKISIRKLRESTKEIMDMVRQGKEVTITYRGKDFALLSPIAQKSIEVEHEAFGMWQDNEKVQDVESFMREVRRARHYDD